MPQTILPLIPQGATQINNVVSVWRGDDKWTYFLGTHPIYIHRQKDQRMFRLVISQLIDSGACRHSEIITTFGVSKSRVNRALKKLREGGPEAFFENSRGRRSGHVFTPEVLEQAQAMLKQGSSRWEVARELGIKSDTLRKAINDGRLNESEPVQESSNKSTRTAEDKAAAEGMGTACIRVEERLLASMGELVGGACAEFKPCLDVPKASALCALPALLANGLLDGAEKMLGKLKGYYSTVHILTLLAFMALCRIKTVEKIRGHAPGEFGKLLGLDRIPEVRCLREKMDALSCGDQSEKWATHLSRQWMQAQPEAVGTLYIDGHVRTYHGKLTKLPRRYISRERLCLRATTDYWVNDAQGLPIFVVEKPIDPGLIATLRSDIVPRLLKDTPTQPSEKGLAENPYRSRFIIVFDREGYSPDLFQEMWLKYRIACMTYHKYPGDSWPEDEFIDQQVVMPRGETVIMKLAERGTLVGSSKSVWMKEVRKLTESGHQTSLISTAYEVNHAPLAARMFSRWCQENFFKYMMEHFAIDLLCEYGTQGLPDTETVVNPNWRQLNKQCNSIKNKLRYRQARFAEASMHPEAESNEKKYQKWLKTKADLLEEIQCYECQLDELKEKLKETAKHIFFNELNEKDKFNRLLPGRKRFMDTVRMIAYRAESAMATMLISSTIDSAEARRILQDLFLTEADILPDEKEGVLRVRIHNASRPATNRALMKLFAQLNETETTYPGTNLRLVYDLVG